MSSPALSPLQIGITGGIGSGKSIVCKIFSCLGIPVYEADARAKWLTNNHIELRQHIVELLGPQAYNPDGFYNRMYVASVVFNDGELLKKLNAIIHPMVMQDTEQWVLQHSSSAYVVKEAAIMNKAGNENSLDFVVMVDAPVSLRIRRIVERDHRNEAEIRAIIDKQVTDQERRKIADFTIINDSQVALIPQVLELHQVFSQGRTA